METQNFKKKEKKTLEQKSINKLKYQQECSFSLGLVLAISARPILQYQDLLCSSLVTETTAFKQKGSKAILPKKNILRIGKKLCLHIAEKL